MIVTEVDVLTLPVVTGKVAVVAPDSTVTDAGTTAAALLLESETTIPPVPAAEVNVTVPVPDCPLVIVPGFTATLLRAGGLGLTVRPDVLLTPE